MIAVIMAAGKGSRLGGYTTNLPKSLLRLCNGGGTLLDYNLDILSKIGIEKILIVTGFKSELIESHTKSDERVKIVYNPFWDSCNVLGSLYVALPYLKEDFLFLHADTLADLAIWKMLMAAEGEMVLPYEKKECGEEEMKIIIDSDNKLLKISKEINPSEAVGEFLGIAKFSKSTIPYFRKTSERLFKKSNLNHYMEAVIQSAISENNLNIKVMDILNYHFVEVDFEQDYKKAQTLFGSN